MRILLSLAFVLTMTGSAISAAPVVQLTKKKETVEVTIGGKLFTVYNTSSKLPKPFFSPVYGLAGDLLKGSKVRVIKNGAKFKVQDKVVATANAGDVLQVSVIQGHWLWISTKKGYINKADVEAIAPVLTRPIIPGEKEHKHHKGIWVAVDEINEIKYWAEQGIIRNAAVDLIKSEGNPAVLRTTNHWLGEDNKPVVTETTNISIYANGLFSYDITFTAGDKQVTFDDTKEGLFGIRMAHSLRESEGGHVISAEGIEGTKGNWGGVHDWIDYYGQVDGQTYGLALFDHPLNFRRSRYHVRNYGLFTINPFGQKAYTGGKRPAAPVILMPGSSLRLRYGLYVHPGDTKAGKVSQTYVDYLKLSNPW